MCNFNVNKQLKLITLAADVARSLGIIFILIVIIREELSFRVGNLVVAEDVWSGLGFFPEILILHC